MYHVIAIVTVVIWGTTFISTKVLINIGLTPTEIFFFRFVMAYVCIWFVSPKRIFANNVRDELMFVLLGLTGGSLYFMAENTALGITFASNVSLILCTTPLLTAFLTFLFYKKEKSLNKNFIIGSCIAILGVALVVYNGSFVLKVSPLGDFLTFIAAITWAFYSVILVRLGKTYTSSFITRKVFFYGIVTLIPFLPFYPIMFDWNIISTPVVMFNLLFLGVIASMLCFLSWNIAVKKIGTIQTSNYLYLVPFVTMIASSVILDEHITTIAIIGSIFILLGVYFGEKK